MMLGYWQNLADVLTARVVHYYSRSAVLSLSTSSVLKWAFLSPNPQISVARSILHRIGVRDALISYLFQLIPVQPSRSWLGLYRGILNADQWGRTAGFELMDESAAALDTAGTVREISSIETLTHRNESSWRLDFMRGALVVMTSKRKCSFFECLGKKYVCKERVCCFVRFKSSHLSTIFQILCRLYMPSKFNFHSI